MCCAARQGCDNPVLALPCSHGVQGAAITLVGTKCDLVDARVISREDAQVWAPCVVRQIVPENDTCSGMVAVDCAAPI